MAARPAEFARGVCRAAPHPPTASPRAHRSVPAHSEDRAASARATCPRLRPPLRVPSHASPPRAWCAEMFSILESVAFDTGYAGSNGLEPQSWVNGNGTSYIYFGSGEFDGQGSGHDFYGTLYMPPSGYVNSCDGGRSHTYCDYRQE